MGGDVKLPVSVPMSCASEEFSLFLPERVHRLHILHFSAHLLRLMKVLHIQGFSVVFGSAKIRLRTLGLSREQIEPG